jgi:hypothetical protein
MPTDPIDDVAIAREASSQDIALLVHEKDEAVLLALLENPRLDESHIRILLERLDISERVIAAIALQTKWLASEAVRFALAAHPHSPRQVAMTMVRQLFVFDLVRLALATTAQPEVRRLAEEAMISKIPQLPIGQKLTLAKRGPSRAVGAILTEGHAQAVAAALTNPLLTESQVLKSLARAETPERVVSAIARHPRWSSSYNVRLALLRNRHTPLNIVLAFLPNLTMRDLREISTLESLSPTLKTYLRREVARRANAKDPALRRT